MRALPRARPPAYAPEMVEAIEESIDIDAPPERVYDMVADLSRMGEWSPENQGGKWLRGATGASQGARFKGRNRIGSKADSHRGETSGNARQCRGPCESQRLASIETGCSRGAG